MNNNFKNKALMGLTAGLTVAAATAQAGVTTTLAASCGAPTTRSYNAPASRSSCGAPSSQNNNYNNTQASNYNSCGAPKSYGYDNNTADNTSINRNPSWSNASEQQSSQYTTPVQGQPSQGWTSTTTPAGKPSGYYYNGQNQTAPNGQPSQGWTSQTNQGTTPGAKSSGYYYNGQNQTAPNGQMNPNSTTNPITTQPSQWSNQGTTTTPGMSR